VHYIASREQNGDALFFMVGWGQVRIQQETHRDTLRQTCVLHPVGSAGHVVHSGVSGVRNGDTIFHAWVGPARIRQKKAP
jgi:hypothetical protein